MSASSSTPPPPSSPLIEAPTLNPKESALAIPGPSTAATDTPVSLQQPPRSPSPNKCSICLGELVNKCYTNSCCHQFCFGCLLEWSKVKPECPLCKSSFRSIYHNIRSIDDYDEYQVPVINAANANPYLSIRLTTSDPFAHILGADIDLRHTHGRGDHGYSHSPMHNYFRERFERIRERDPRVIRILELGPVSERRSFETFMNSGANHALDNPFYTEQAEYFGSYHDGTSATSTSNPVTIQGYQNRRRIYDRNQWVLPFHSTLQAGTVFFPSVEYFRTHPSAFGRVNQWLYRELTVLLGLSRSRTEMGFVYDIIMGLLLRFDIRSREFREMIRIYFGARVKQFQHEFYYFVLSGMRAESYDRVAAYPSNTESTNSQGPSQSAMHSGPPPVVTLGDTDDEDSNEPDVIILDEEAETEGSPESMPTTDSNDNDDEDDNNESQLPRPRRPLPSNLLASEAQSVIRGTIILPEANHTADELETPHEHLRQCCHGRSTGLSPQHSRRGISHPWYMPPRPLTDEDFPILNLRSRAANRTEQHLQQTGHCAPSRSGQSSSTLPYASHSESCRHHGDGRNSPELPSLSTLIQASTVEAELEGVSNALRGVERPSRSRASRRRSRRSSGGRFTAYCNPGPSSAHSFRATFEPAVSVPGLDLSLTHERRSDAERQEARKRTSSAIVVDLEEDKPDIKIPKPDANAASAPESEDEEDCLFVGIQPIVKKPPLAVITISSEDEEVAESSKRLKAEKHEQERIVQVQDFMERLGGSQSSEELNVMNQNDSSESLDYGSIRSGPGGSNRKTDFTNLASTSTSMTTRVSSRKCSKSKKSKKCSRATKKSVLLTSSDSDSDDDGERCSNAKKRAGSKKHKRHHHRKSRMHTRSSRKRANSGEPSGKSRAKRSKKSIPTTTSSDSSSSSSSPAVTTTSRRRNVAEEVGRLRGSTIESILGDIESSSHQFSPVLGSSSSAIDLSTRSDDQLSQRATSYSARRWESDDGEEDSNLQPMFLTEPETRMRPRHHWEGSSSSSNSSMIMPEDTSPFSGGLISGGWRPEPPTPPMYEGSNLSVLSSSSSSNQTEDEAGLNARPLGAAEIESYAGNGYIQSVIGFTPRPHQNSPFYPAQPPPTLDSNQSYHTGLDLRFRPLCTGWPGLGDNVARDILPENGPRRSH